MTINIVLLALAGASFLLLLSFGHLLRQISSRLGEANDHLTAIEHIADTHLSEPDLGSFIRKQKGVVDLG